MNAPTQTFPPIQYPQSTINMPTQVLTSPQATAITSQNVPNGCVSSIIGRSGEDRYVTAVINSNIQMYAIFDGHGGKIVAEYLRDNLPIALARALLGINFNDVNTVKTIITNTFIEFDRNMFHLKMKSGSTAIVALYFNKIVYLINLGDALAVIFDNNRRIIAETHDH